MNRSYDKQMGFSTIGLIRGCYSWIFAVMFWFTVIGFMIGGAGAAQGLYNLANIVYGEHGGVQLRYTVVGGALGLIVGFIIAVWVGGVVATLLKMDENLQYLVDKEKAKV